MLARLCFDNLLLIDELLLKYPEKKKYEIATKRKKKLNKNSFK